MKMNMAVGFHDNASPTDSIAPRLFKDIDPYPLGPTMVIYVSYTSNIDRSIDLRGGLGRRGINVCCPCHPFKSAF